MYHEHCSEGSIVLLVGYIVVLVYRDVLIKPASSRLGGLHGRLRLVMCLVGKKKKITIIHTGIEAKSPW